MMDKIPFQNKAGPENPSRALLIVRGGADWLVRQ